MEREEKMKKIFLCGDRGSGLFALVDSENYEYLSKFNWFLHSAGYAVRNKGKITVLMHREIVEISETQQIDHKNGNRLDNRKSNLRIASQSQNMANTRIRKDNVLGFKGVSERSIPRQGNFLAKICFNGKPLFIGSFKNPIDAAKAYDKKAIELFGDFAQLNFPESRYDVND